jgi:hypothetical protein
LARIEKYRAATRDTSCHSNVVLAAVIEVNLLCQGLVAAHQGRGWKAQKAQCVRYVARPVGFDYGLPDGNIQAAFDDAGIDDTECL